jgi:hypothetical protein
MEAVGEVEGIMDGKKASTKKKVEQAKTYSLER